MKLKCLGSSSAGNCYLLTSGSGETLIIDCGIPIKEIKKGLGWNIKDVVGVLCTHRHQDHSKSLNDFKSMGIPILAQYLGDSCKSMNMGEFTVKPFDLTTMDGNWTHTDANGEPCPIYGFLITHKEMGRLLYITDCEVIKWKFKDIDHILLGVNYDKDMVDWSNPTKNNHVFRGHLEIGTACDFVNANYSDRLQNVIMCHLSSENICEESALKKMQSTINCNVYVAKKGFMCELKKDSCPF